MCLLSFFVTCEMKIIPLLDMVVCAPCSCVSKSGQLVSWALNSSWIISSAPSFSDGKSLSVVCQSFYTTSTLGSIFSWCLSIIPLVLIVDWVYPMVSGLLLWLFDNIHNCQNICACRLLLKATWSCARPPTLSLLVPGFQPICCCFYSAGSVLGSFHFLEPSLGCFCRRCPYSGKTSSSPLAVEVTWGA